MFYRTQLGKLWYTITNMIKKKKEWRVVLSSALSSQRTSGKCGGGATGQSEEDGDLACQRLLIPAQPTVAVFWELPYSRTMSAEAWICLPGAPPHTCPGAASPSLGTFCLSGGNGHFLWTAGIGLPQMQCGIPFHEVEVEGKGQGRGTSLAAPPALPTSHSFCNCLPKVSSTPHCSRVASKALPGHSQPCPWPSPSLFRGAVDMWSFPLIHVTYHRCETHATAFVLCQAPSGWPLNILFSGTSHATLSPWDNIGEDVVWASDLQSWLSPPGNSQFLKSPLKI